MSVRIRVYPQTGAMGGLGMNGYGGAVSAQQFYSSKLNSQKQVSNLQLGYERALADERINNVRLEERLKNPYLQTGVNGLGALGGYGGLGAYGALGGLPMGGFGMPMGGLPINQMAGGIPAGFGGGGQSNVTNQTSTGAGSQSVTNSNVNNVSSVQQPYAQGGWGSPQTQFGGGGFLSGLLGALI